jgi:O-methyltransferase
MDRPLDETPPEDDIDRGAHERMVRSETHWARKLYVRWIYPRIQDPVVRQRFKMFWFLWGYAPLLVTGSIPFRVRLRLLGAFLRVDWNVLHCHLPSETSTIARELASRPARPDEVVVEAGCFQGGSSAKFSLLCRALGFRLHIYDSFEGVEALDPSEHTEEWDFAGQYASPESRLRHNLEAYGAPEVCEIHKGWFSETLAAHPIPHPVRLAYIDCDLAKGTREVLEGVMPSLAEDGCIVSQDFHIDPVRRLLLDPSTWRDLGRPDFRVRPRGVYLATVHFPAGPVASSG